MKKTALITGSAKRIGAVIAQHLAAAGYDIVIHYHRSVVEAKQLADQLTTQYRVKASTVAADLANLVQVENLWQQIIAQAGQIDLLINNAAWFDPANDPVEHSDPQITKTVWQINTHTPQRLSELFAAQNGLTNGHIINILDYRVLKPSGSFPIYTASKTALWQVTQQLALDYAPTVRVNALALGMAMRANDQTQEHFEKHIMAAPLQRSGDADEIACAVLALENLSSVTGQILALDGGMHLTNVIPTKVGIQWPTVQCEALFKKLILFASR